MRFTIIFSILISSLIANPILIRRINNKAEDVADAKVNVANNKSVDETLNELLANIDLEKDISQLLDLDLDSAKDKGNKNSQSTHKKKGSGDSQGGVDIDVRAEGIDAKVEALEDGELVDVEVSEGGEDIIKVEIPAKSEEENDESEDGGDNGDNGDNDDESYTPSPYSEKDHYGKKTPYDGHGGKEKYGKDPRY